VGLTPTSPEAETSSITYVARLISRAHIATGAIEAESPPADAAVQRADQVVAVLVRAIAAGTMGIEHLLDPLECRAVNDGLVATGSLDALECDDPDVVIVAEQPVNHAARQRLARPLVGAAPPVQTVGLARTSG
jgi:hypothetical protein